MCFTYEDRIVMLKIVYTYSIVQDAYICNAKNTMKIEFDMANHSVLIPNDNKTININN